MAISSMTGFARFEGSGGDTQWSWEVRSVNGKGLDIRCRLAPGFEGLEPRLRETVGRRLRRGSIFVGLSLTRRAAGGGYRVNEAVLERVVAVLPEIGRRVPDARPPSLDGLLALRGVMEPVDEDVSDEAHTVLEKALLADLEEALGQLSTMRRREGTRLRALVEARLEEMAELSARAEALAALQPAAIRERIRCQVGELLDGLRDVPEDRLLQEVAIVLTRSDAREELDRIKVHEEAARALLSADGAVGRKLDFICQELNREANTLCSKSQAVALTQVGLDMKVAIDRMREQVQNIE